MKGAFEPAFQNAFYLRGTVRTMNDKKYLCPYCEKEMEKGLFMSRGANYFLPDGEKIPSLNLEK